VAAADPVQALEVAKRVARVYAAAELELRGKVAKRLARGIDQEGWAEKKLAELGQVRADADAVVKRLNGQAPQVVRSALEEVAGVDPTLSPKTNRRAVDALVEQTVTKLQTTHFQLLRSTQDQFRQTVAQTVTQVATGQTTYRVAAQRVQRQLASQGLGFVDAKGRAWKLDTYAKMAVRTAAAQAMVGARLNEYAEAGRTLVIVSDSPDECDKCRPWEGQVLLIDGVQATPEDRKLAAATVKEATADGLFHPNCTHDLRPYIPGLTRPFESTARDQNAEALRRERAKAESKLQEAKREDVATAPFGDSPVRDQVKAKLASAESKLDELPAEPAPRPVPKDPTARVARSINDRTARAEAEGAQASRTLDVDRPGDGAVIETKRRELEELGELLGEDTSKGFGYARSAFLEDVVVYAEAPDVGITGAYGGQVLRRGHENELMELLFGRGTEPPEDIFYVGFMGSTDTVSGTGAQLAKDILLACDDLDRGLLLEPADDAAATFWQSAGLRVDPYDLGETAYSGLTKDEVKKLAQLIRQGV
jgi:hypothetical protein